MKIKVVTNMVGTFSIIVNENIGFHFLLKTHDCDGILLGYNRFWYDGPIHEIGFGKLLLVVWDNYPRHKVMKMYARN